MPDNSDDLNRFTFVIIESAIRIHRALGPGLLESAYHACLVHALRARGLSLEVQKALPLVFEGVAVDCAYRADLVVERKVLVEVKATESLAPIHVRQVFTYVRIANVPIGLLLNFGAPTMKAGIKRVVNGFPE